jgi:hypothetical protein
MLQFALVRALEIVGEAAARVSEPTRISENDGSVNALRLQDPLLRAFGIRFTGSRFGLVRRPRRRVRSIQATRSSL